MCGHDGAGLREGPDLDNRPWAPSASSGANAPMLEPSGQDIGIGVLGCIGEPRTRGVGRLGRRGDLGSSRSLGNHGAEIS